MKKPHPAAIELPENEGRMFTACMHDMLPDSGMDVAVAVVLSDAAKVVMRKNLTRNEELEVRDLTNQEIAEFSDADKAMLEDIYQRSLTVVRQDRIRFLGQANYELPKGLETAFCVVITDCKTTVSTDDCSTAVSMQQCDEMKPEDRQKLEEQGIPIVDAREINFTVNSMLAASGITVTTERNCEELNPKTSDDPEKIRHFLPVGEFCYFMREIGAKVINAPDLSQYSDESLCYVHQQIVKMAKSMHE